MNQLQEVNLLLKKRIQQLERKKQKCLDYSSMPNRCVDKVEAQIKRVRKMARIARLRSKTMENDSLVDSYLDMLTEIGPKSPAAKVATVGALALGAHKVAKSAIMRSRCKEYKYSPYLYKRCRQGLDESEELTNEYYQGGNDVNIARRLGPVYGEKHLKKVEKTKAIRKRVGIEEADSVEEIMPLAAAVPAVGAAAYLLHRRKKKRLAKQQTQKTMNLKTEAEGWEKMPKGWKQSSLKKFSKSLTGKKATQKGFFDKCVKRMEGKLDNPQAFCASIKDERHGSTFWRGKGKTPQQAGKDVKRIQNVKRG